MGFKLELGPEPGTAGSFSVSPGKEMEDSSQSLCVCQLGIEDAKYIFPRMQVFFPSTHPPFVMVVRFPGQATKAYLPQS